MDESAAVHSADTSLLDTYAQLSGLAGYLAYDLRDYAGAEQPLLDSLRWCSPDTPAP